jgi:hypothetical protein
MNLQDIAATCKKEEHRLPIEVPTSEKFTHSRELDTEALDCLYFDETHKHNLPVFAAASIHSQGGCKLEATLRSDMDVPFQTTDSGSLAENLPSIPYWESVLKNCKNHKSNYGWAAAYHLILLATAAAAAISVALDSTHHHTPLSERVPAALFLAFLVFAVSETLLSFALGLHTRILQATNPDTVENRRIYGRDYTATFSASLPGHIPEEARTLIRQEAPNYKDIHLLWEATNLWEFKGVKSQKRPNPDPLIFGETKDGKFILLGNFDCTPREEAVRDKFC